MVNKSNGELTLFEGTWYVSYKSNGIWNILKIYPKQDIKELVGSPTEGIKVEFEITDEFSHPYFYEDVGLYEGEPYALITKKIEDENNTGEESVGHRTVQE